MLSKDPTGPEHKNDMQRTYIKLLKEHITVVIKYDETLDHFAIIVLFSLSFILMIQTIILLIPIPTLL